MAGSSGGADPGKEAALTRFLVQRAEAMTADGDLRGMGRTVAASHLEQITLSDPSGDSPVSYTHPTPPTGDLVEI